MNRSVLAWVWLLAVAGCGGNATAPPQPSPPPPPQVEAMYPPPRSFRVDDATPIWVSFKEPLDPSTVNERTVFLKVDALRIPVEVSWDAAGKRIVIATQGPLDIATTHTVILSPAIQTATGVALDAEVWWQFRTTTVRVPLPRSPADGAPWKGPWTTLAWRPTESYAGTVRYAVYAGSDSLAVAARTEPVLREVDEPRLRPNPPWPAGAAVYWAVTVTNRTTGESADGPVSRFHVIPAGTPVDSIKIGPTDWGMFDSNFPTNHPCYGTTIAFGETAVGACRYDVSALPPETEIIEARLDAPTTPVYWQQLPNGATLWAASGPWLPCLIGSPGPPFPDESLGILARGFALVSARMRYEGAPFTAWLQQKITDGVPVELMPRASRWMIWVQMDSPENLRPLIVIRYYRPPATTLSVAPPNAREGVGRPRALRLGGPGP